MTEVIEDVDLLSLLPAEVFHNHLFPHLDVFSLISLGSTCQYLHSVTNASEAWRSRALSKFGGLPNENEFDGSHKRYFLEKACVRFDGVYISRCVYYRKVRPTGNIHLTDEQRKDRKIEPLVLPVCYYRYLMFIPNTNKCLCMRSEASQEDAVKVLNECYSMLQRLPRHQLKSLEAEDLGVSGSSSEEARRLRQIVLGEWSFVSSLETDSSSSLGVVTLSYFEPSNFNSTRYFNEAQLTLSHQRVVESETHCCFKRWNSRLEWLSFSITAAGHQDRRHSLSLNSTHFKPFTFSRIRSMAHQF